jgi:hypothetical protein
MLVALAIIMILAYMYYPKIAADHSDPGAPATPRERAYGAACSEYESQMNDKPPRSLEELKQYGVTEDQIHAEGCYFQIDPATGHVSDLGQGHYVPVNPPASAIYGGHATGFHPDDPSPAPPSSPPPVYSPSVPPPPPAAGSPSPPGGGGTVGPGGIRIPNEPTIDPNI